MSYSPSPHSYDSYGGYSPSPWLANTNHIPAHLLRPSHHPHQYHHTPLSSSASNDALSQASSSLSSSLRHSSTMPIAIGGRSREAAGGSSAAGGPAGHRSTVVLSQYRYAGGYELGPVIGVGTYGEVRYGRSIDGSNLSSSTSAYGADGLDEEAGGAALRPSSSSPPFAPLLPSASVAIKLIDLARFTDDTAALMRKEILILQLLQHQHVVRLLDLKEDVAYTGEWCDHCACTQYRRSALTAGQCANCGHAGSEHTQEETRPVMMLVQELAIAGELFGLLMHTGPMEEDTARFYFRQLIDGLEHCHQHGVVHRDLKPENLCLNHNFQLKIIDFGLSAMEHQDEQHDQGGGGGGGGGGDAAVAAAAADSAMSRSRSLSSTSMTSLSRQRSPSLRSSLAGCESDALLLQSHSRQLSGVGSCPYSAPEVFYISSLYNNRPYRGCCADVWSCGIILFVMLLGRPPFMRPLAKTYGSNMRRCRHFVSVMKVGQPLTRPLTARLRSAQLTDRGCCPVCPAQGEGFGGMSSGAKDLISKLMRMTPSERLTLRQIREDAWFQGPLPSLEDVQRQMEERSREAYRKMEKAEMIALMDAVRKEDWLQRQQHDDWERERQREAEGDREREPSDPHTPRGSSAQHQHQLPFPSLSPHSGQRDSFSGRHSPPLFFPSSSAVRVGGGEAAASSSGAVTARMEQPQSPSAHVAVSRLSLSDDAGIAAVPRAAQLFRPSADAAHSASSSSSSSPSPPPQPAYPAWAFR